MGSKGLLFGKYLDAFTSGNIDEAKELVAEDYSFVGPMMQAEGKTAFFEGAAGLRTIVDGYKMLHQWEDGDEVCSIFEFKIKSPVGGGAVLMSEWATVRDGKLAASRLIFDTAAFAALMPQ